MKPTWVIARIVIALAAIFAIGIWVGRMTVTPQEVAVETEDESEASAPRSGTAADTVSRRVIPRYRTELGLSEDQVQELRPFFYHAGREMAKHPPQSEGRLRAIERFHGRIVNFLNDEQKVKLAGILDGARKRRAGPNQ